MKQNSSAAGKSHNGCSNGRVVQHGQQQQQTGHWQQHMQPVGMSHPYQQGHASGHPQSFPTNFPGAAVHPPVSYQHQSYTQQQKQQRPCPMQMSSGINSATDFPAYASMGQPVQTQMVIHQPNFLASPEHSTGHQLQQQQQQQHRLMMAQQQPLSSTPAGMACYASAGHTVGAGFQQYQQQQQQQQLPTYTTMQAFPSDQFHRQQQTVSPQWPTTAEPQYFLDANCTTPVGQQQPSTSPVTGFGCSNPKCSKCVPSKRP